MILGLFLDWKLVTCKGAKVQNQPEVAVPVLVEVVRLMTPASSDGQKAYQSLIELGFVETPFAGAKSAK